MSHDPIDILKAALRVSADRFTDPKWGCEWRDAGIACLEAIKQYDEQVKFERDLEKND